MPLYGFRLGQRIAHGYDILNRETTEAWYAVGGGGAVNLLTFTYDTNNNLLTAANSAGTVTRTYDALDRPASGRDVFGTALTYTYDAADNRTLVQDSFGGITTRTYDVLNRTTTMQFGGPSQTPLRLDSAYTVRDEVARLTRYSNLAGTTTVGYSTMGYDAVGRLTGLQHLNGSGTSLARYVNAFDLAGRITSEALNGGSPTTYQYDVTDQVTNDAVVTYTYDLNGNRTMSGYATGTANRMTSDGVWNYTADANGNQTGKTKISNGQLVTYTYDVRNRMTAMQDTLAGALQSRGTYVYDALGQRVQREARLGGVTTITRFAYDDMRQVWADTNTSNVVQQRYLRTDRMRLAIGRAGFGQVAACWVTARPTGVFARPASRG